MKNHLPNAVELFSRHGQDVKSCGVIEPGEKFNVPLSDVYTPDGYFLLKPKDSGLVLIELIYYSALKNLGNSCKATKKNAEFKTI